MKKLLSLFITVLVCTFAYGQVYLGGSIGGSKNVEGYSFDITPEIGYCINDNNSVSLSVGYSAIKTEGMGGAASSLYVAPCYTYTVPISDKWCFDVNATAGYSRAFRENANILGFYVGPQLEYSLTEHWTIWGAFDLISLEYDWYDGESASTNVNFDLFDTGINFGFYYYF